jgi:hypothetical protein
MRYGRKAVAVLLAAVLCCAALPSCFAAEDDSAQRDKEASVPAQQIPESLDDALVTVVAGDVRGMLEKLGDFIASVVPGYPEGGPRIQVGKMLGDPELAGLSGGAVALAFPDQVKVALLEVSPKKADAYLEVAAKSFPQTGKTNGFLLLSDTEAGIEAGKKLASQVKSDLLKPVVPGVQVTVPVSKLMKQYDQQVQFWLKSLPMMIQLQQSLAAKRTGNQDAAVTTGMAVLLEAEMRFLYRIVRKVDMMKIGIDLPPGGIRIDSVFVPVAAASGSGTSGNVRPAAELRKIIPARGAFRAVMTYDARKMSALMTEELGGVLEEMNLPVSESEPALKMLGEWMKISGNGAAFDMITPGKSFIGGSPPRQQRCSRP